MAKRKPGRRHPCGKLIQPTAQERAEIAKRQGMVELQTVMNQPHRRDAADPRDEWLETELGRFCRRHRLREEIKKGAEEWADISRLFRAAWGAPMPERLGSIGVTGEGPSWATVEAWRGQLQNIEDKLYGDTGRNKARYSATYNLVFRGLAPTRELEPYALDGLRVVAIELGRMSKRDAPFQEAA